MFNNSSTDYIFTSHLLSLCHLVWSPSIMPADSPEVFL